MPLPLFTLPHGLLAHQTQVRELPGGLVIHWREQSLTFSPRVLRFTRGVTAQYGETIVECEELEVHEDPGGSYAIARGHVKLSDPVGKLTSSQIRFSWVGATGSADDVEIIVDSLKAKVVHIDLQPQKWTLREVSAVGYANSVALIHMKSPRVDITPGKSVVVRKPKVGLLGLLVGPLPDAHSSIGGGGNRIRYPVPSYKQDHGFGISWDSRIPVGRKSLLTGSYGNYARTVPTYGFQLSTTFVKGRGSAEALPPRYDLGDRFDPSYFQSVLVNDPYSDWRFYGYQRKTLSLSTVGNSPASGRDDFGHYNKPWDLVYEQSGMVGTNALYGQIRGQQIRRGGEHMTTRMTAWVSAAPKPIEITPQIHAHATLEGSYYGDKGFYWGRVQTGLTYRPVSFLRFSGGGFWGREFGDPGLPADKLDRLSGFVTRADLISGPTQFSYMMKFDPRGGGQYDREYSLTQAVGILQAYINYRMVPSQFRYGVQLRLDSLLDSLTRRSQQERRVAKTN